MEKESFTTFDATRICETRYQRLREWIGRKHIKPSINKAEGVGTKTLFSRSDLYLIALFKMLVGKGFSRDDAKFAIEGVNSYLTVAQTWSDPSQNSHLIFIENKDLSGKFVPKVYVLNDEWFKEKSVFDLLTHEGYYEDALEYDKFVMVNFKKIRKQIDMAIE